MVDFKGKYLAALRRSRRNSFLVFLGETKVVAQSGRQASFLVCGMPKSGKTYVASVIRSVWPLSIVKEQRLNRSAAGRLFTGAELFEHMPAERIYGYDAIFLTSLADTDDGVRVKVMRYRWHEADRIGDLFLEWIPFSEP